MIDSTYLIGNYYVKILASSYQRSLSAWSCAKLQTCRDLVVINTIMGFCLSQPIEPDIWSNGRAS